MVSVKKIEPEAVLYSKQGDAAIFEQVSASSCELMKELLLQNY